MTALSDEMLSDLAERYYVDLAAAFVRGRLGELDPRSPEDLLRAGLAAGLQLHKFKRNAALPRVAKVLGILRGLAPASLLDVGSGRGAFLWPLLDAMPWLPVTALDVRADRVAGIQAAAEGGVESLAAIQGDATRLPFDNGQFDAVTLLEVLEHIPDAAAALAQACRVARRFVVLSVPSKPDDNPEHIHLFGAAQLEALLRGVSARRVSFEYVPGHLIAVARITS